MSEQRSERAIEGATGPEWGRFPVAAVGLVGFLLAAIVGLTSADSPWLTGDGGRPSTPAVVGQVLAVGLAAGLCAVLGLIWIHTPRRDRATKRAGAGVTPEELGASLRAGSFVLIGGILAAAVLVLAISFLLGQAAPGDPSPSVTTTTTGGAGAVPSSGPSPSAPPVFGWFLVGLIASAAIVLPLGLVVRRRLRPADPEQEVGAAPASVVRALGDSIDEIERDPDARRAIIRAYARMEHAFDDAGMPRRPYEAPFEYLGRALRGLRVSPPVAVRLAVMFERARFSQHVVGADTKQDAIGALREVEREMQAPSP